MLVDSGAELSLISLKVGQDLGYALADSESTLLAETIGGRVEYVLRNVEMTIDEHNFITPVAWLQTNTGGEQLLLGREVVFDKFNIEFRQAEEQIIFTQFNKIQNAVIYYRVLAEDVLTKISNLREVLMRLEKQSISYYKPPLNYTPVLRAIYLQGRKGVILRFSQNES